TRRVAPLVVLAVAPLGGLGVFWPLGQPEPTLQLPGTVEAQEVRLSSKVGGRVMQVAVVEGQWVQPGQPLVYLDREELGAQRAQVQARLEAAEAALKKAQAGSRPEEKAAARAALRGAEARQQRIEAGTRPEEIEQARHELAGLLAALDRAEREGRR